MHNKTMNAVPFGFVTYFLKINLLYFVGIKKACITLLDDARLAGFTPLRKKPFYKAKVLHFFIHEWAFF